MAQVEVSGSAGVEAFGYRQELKRALSLFDLLVYGLVFIAPIAPFSVFGFVFNASNGMVPLVYMVGLGAMLFTALGFLGFDAISTLSEEAKGGVHTVGIATVLSLILAAVLFIGQTYLASLFVLDQSSFPAGDESANAFLTMASIVGGEAFKVVAAVLGLAMVSQLELLVSLVNFGALFGFLMLHLSVVIHFMRRGPSRWWIMHLVVPSIGFVVISYVLINADAMAKIAGSVWLTIGVAVLVTLKTRGRRATLQAEDLG